MVFLYQMCFPFPLLQEWTDLGLGLDQASLAMSLSGVTWPSRRIWSSPPMVILSFSMCYQSCSAMLSFAFSSTSWTCLTQHILLCTPLPRSTRFPHKASKLLRPAELCFFFFFPASKPTLCDHTEYKLHFQCTDLVSCWCTFEVVFGFHSLWLKLSWHVGKKQH